MATFRKRSNSWQARVQRHGYPDISKSFKTRSEAVAWARKVESDIDQQTADHPSKVNLKVTLKELLEKYQQEVTPHKKHSSVESYRIARLIKHPMADKPIAEVKSADIARWRDERIKQGRAPNTIRLELAILSNLFTVAASDWGYEWLDNPTKRVKIPKLPSGRVRRLAEGELKQILTSSESALLKHIVTLAVETGMRRGEIVAIQNKHINLNKRTLLIPVTKNGEAREIPLSSVAIKILKERMSESNDRLFDITPHAITIAFGRACKRSGLEDIHFHDLRHEAISRFFEKDLSLAEVATISGHKTWTMLRRYTHLSAEKIASKL
ncbi:MAG: site-specific integrase [Nitrosomonadales bacterium]|nr:site-specific integrase [Nitrosomonadales bacterium]